MDMAKPTIRFKGYQDDWEQRKLGEHCEMYNGDRSSKYPNAQDMVAEGIPFINAGDLENGRVNLTECNKISREKYDDLGGAKLQLGDIVYCLRGTLGKNAYIDNFTEGTVASSLVAIRPKNIDGRFMFHVLNSDIEYRQRMVHDEGAAQPNLSAKSVSEFIMPVPHIDEQKEISAYFDNLDHLITLHQRKCDETKKLKKYMLQKMFPQNGEKVPEIRFLGFTDDWEQRKLGATNTFFTDGNYGEAYPKSSDMTDSGSGIPFLTGGNLKDGKLSLDGASYITPEKHSKLTSGHLFEDDIVIAVRGSLGALGYVNTDNSGWNINSQLAILRTDKSELYGKFLIQYLLSWTGQNELLKRQTGSALKQLPIGAIKDVEVPITSIAEQGKIGEYFADLDNLITLHQRELENLQNIKRFMLGKMFV